MEVYKQEEDEQITSNQRKTLMGSSVKLPIIDFSVPNLKPGTAEWELLKSESRKALEQYGCFEALFDKLPPDLKTETIRALKELFDLPLQTKLRNISRKPYHGYVGQFPQVPLYESMGFESPNVVEKLDATATLLWPEGNPSFSKTLQSYAEKLSELDEIVRRMMVESLGLEKYMDEHMNSTEYLLRVMKYRGPETGEKKLGLTQHTDKNIVTILFQNEVAGLEVLTKDGEWVDAELSSPNSFIVMIGDSLLAWVNGRLHSAVHRVMMTGNESRYSLGLFSIPKPGYIIKAPEEVVDEEHPLLFKPFDHFKFLGYYYSEAGQKDKSALKTFCGV